MSAIGNRVQRLEQAFCPGDKPIVLFVHGMNTDFWYILDDDGNKVEIDKHSRNIICLEPEDRFI